MAAVTMLWGLLAVGGCGACVAGRAWRSGRVVACLAAWGDFAFCPFVGMGPAARSSFAAVKKLYLEGQGSVVQTRPTVKCAPS